MPLYDGRKHRDGIHKRVGPSSLLLADAGWLPYTQAMGIRGEVFSTRARTTAERRTYFFNVKENRTGDLFLTVVESKKHGESDFQRHQVVVFQEDIDSFMEAMNKAVRFMRQGPSENSGDGYGKRRSPGSGDGDRR